MSDVGLSLRQMAGVLKKELPEPLIGQLEVYAQQLLQTNATMNLTRITQPEEVAVKHFLDSLLALDHWTIPSGVQVADVGSGAGFPGLVWAMARPDLQLTLMDSLGKRVRFLQGVSDDLHVGARAVHIRAEDAGQSPIHRQKYQVATARAVARLPVLLELCLPLVEVGGVFLALKGPEVQEEVVEAQRAAEVLGGELVDVYAYSLPGGHGERGLAVYGKRRPTPAGYPRRPGKPEKQPLGGSEISLEK